MIGADGNIEHIERFGFEYKRVGSIAVAKIFGKTIYKQVGELSKLFGVAWNGYPTARIH